MIIFKTYIMKIGFFFFNIMIIFPSFKEGYFKNKFTNMKNDSN